MDSESDERSGHHKRQSKRIKTSHNMVCASASALTPHFPLPFNFLPFELNTDILSRLPVKSLSRFKCVSKSWLSFIGSPQFIKAHLATSSENGEGAYHKFIFTILPPNANLKECSLRSVVSEANTEVVEVNYSMKSPRKSVWVVGYCQGLVCYAIEEKYLFLWNPVTGKSKKLPDLSIRLKNGCYVLYGFGYDGRNDDYKVVGIFCVFCGAGVYETEVRVYSLKTDTWRRIEDFRGGSPVDDSGKYANGKLHWAASPNFASSSGSNYEWKIISLDLLDETYGEVDRPDYGNNIYDWMFGVVDGCLSVLCNYQRSRADLWVMKEYGESWSKLVSIPFLSCPDNSTYHMPLAILKDGEILLIFGTTFVLYNPKQNTFKYPRFNNLATFLEVDMYIESLVSPCDGTETQGA